MNTQQVKFVAVGFRFRDRTSSCVNDGTLRLMTEPNNEYDKNAIKLLVDDQHVGFVSRNDTRQVAPLLENEYNI